MCDKVGCCIRIHTCLCILFATASLHLSDLHEIFFLPCLIILYVIVTQAVLHLLLLKNLCITSSKAVLLHIHAAKVVQQSW